MFYILSFVFFLYCPSYSFLLPLRLFLFSLFSLFLLFLLYVFGNKQSPHNYNLRWGLRIFAIVKKEKKKEYYGYENLLLDSPEELRRPHSTITLPHCSNSSSDSSPSGAMRRLAASSDLRGIVVNLEPSKALTSTS